MKLKIVIIFLLIFSACRYSAQNDQARTGTEDDWALLDFVKADSINPIIEPSSDQIFFSALNRKEVRWEEKNVLNPSAVVKDGKVYLVYRAQDSLMTSRLGLAVSDDGLHFIKELTPVLYPDSDTMQQYEWKGGVEDPRIVEGEDGTYILTYTSYDGRTARLCLASSKDLVNWTKHGLVLREGKYKDTWSKSGAIVSRLQGGTRALCFGP
jgi:predicted GH43/DUF377 family glycosyl hydrolase